MICCFFGVYVYLLRFLELKFFSFLSHFFYVVVNGKAGFGELYLVTLTIISSEISQVNLTNSVLILDHISLQCLHTGCHLVNCRTSSTSLLLHHLQVFEVFLFLLVQNLLEVSVHIFPFMLLKFVLGVLDASEASLHILHHSVDIAHFAFCMLQKLSSSLSVT